jgi:L-alanine-DL-glutamate epimerase-like enolase superfamily enzyme
MKIAKAETILISVPFESGGLPPWGWGGAPANTFDTLLVRLETEDGLVGWGEAFSRMSDVALKQVIDTRVLPLVVGRDARQIARIKHDVEFNLHNFGRSGGIMYGISAVDIALWDLAGKRAGRPLAELLGGATANEVEVYASLVRYGTGENAGSLFDFVAMQQAGAIDIAQPDVAKTGGVTELVKISRFCEAHGLTFSPHCAIFGPGQIATIHLTATEVRPPLFERLYLDFEAELFGEAAVVNNGRLEVPTDPGLGAEPDPAVIARYRVA